MSKLGLAEPPLQTLLTTCLTSFSDAWVLLDLGFGMWSNSPVESSSSVPAKPSEIVEVCASFSMPCFEEIRRDRDLYFGDFPSQEEFDREIEKNTA